MLYRCIIGGRTEFIYKCDICGFCLNTVHDRDETWGGAVCPRCKKEIDTGQIQDIPESEFRSYCY